jgi:hypothetical protein
MFVPADDCTFSVGRPGYSVASYGDLGKVDVITQAGCNWRITSDSNWITFTGDTSVAGSGSARFRVDPNPSLRPRTATFTINNRTPNPPLVSDVNVPVYQLASMCNYALASPSITLAATGGTGSVALSTTPSCEWASVAAPRWITPTTIPGVGPGAVTYTASGNPGGARTGSLMVGGQFLQVLEKGAVSPQVFEDVGSSHPFFDFISLLRQNHVATGCGASTFCPETPTTRSQMAQWIILSLLGDDFTYSPDQTFTDVPVSHPHFKYVQKLKELGITSGCRATQYCPNDSVTRVQMAAFVIRAKFGLLAGQTFPFPPAPYFTDVAADDPFFGYVQKMRDLAITLGCTTTQYCPDQPATRGQMAVFLVRGFFTP